MTALRWVLGLGTGAFALGWGFLVMAGDGFRGSLGASANAWWKGVAPIAVAVLLLLAILLPERRILLHAGAVAAVGLLVWSLFVARETLFVASVGVIYCVCWLIFYYRWAWGGVGAALPSP